MLTCLLDFRTYIVTCENDLAGVLTETVTALKQTAYTFTETDGVVGDTMYFCSVQLVLPDGRTSGNSIPSIVTTTMPKCELINVFY